MNYKTKQFEIKSLSDTGEVTGYFSTFDVIADSYGDIVAPSAFDKTIKQRAETGRPFPLVWNHQMDDPELIIGQVDSIKNDERGALMTGHFYDTPKAQAARNLVKEGAVYQFSFAYDIESAREPNDAEKAQDPKIKQVLEGINLIEVTITPTPANPRAEVLSAKSGRRNRKTDEDIIKQIISLANQLLDDEVDDTVEDSETTAKSEEPDTANDEERARINLLLKETENLLAKGAKS